MRATYRLQLNSRFAFDTARKWISYLADLGISHCYTSPILKARPQSPHGYDIVDHQSLNPEIGSNEDFDAFVEELHAHSMGLVLDIVPNHMGVMGADNHWWMDVLENGPASRYASFFDIDWFPQKKELWGKILVAVLGDHYGNVLAGGELALVFESETGSFAVRYYEHRFPIDPVDYAQLLRHESETLRKRLAGAPTTYDALMDLAGQFENLPGRAEALPEKRALRDERKETLKKELAVLCGRCPELTRFVNQTAAAQNTACGGASGYGPLHDLLERQAYRLAYWKTASDEINYRRFFDINDLAGIRQEKAPVFAETHRLIQKWVQEGAVDGLRVDHPDGLRDPAGYFARLRALTEKVPPVGGETASPVRAGRTAGDAVRGSEDVVVEATRGGGETVAARSGGGEAVAAKRGGSEVYIVAEKILAGHEHLRQDWPIDGTTGYEFANRLNGLFVDPAGERSLTATYSWFIRRRLAFDEVVYRCKKHIIDTVLTSELNVLADELNRLSESDPTTRDFTRSSLQAAIAEIVACFPVYRTYVNEAGPEEMDLRYFDWAVAQAAKRRAQQENTVLDFIHRVLCCPAGGAGQSESYLQAVRSFTQKLQQYTAPVMAKGLEDTAFYVYGRLLSLNEVGGEPEKFATSVKAFHYHNGERYRRGPRSMVATTTHDSKRSEDVRARLNVLSEMGEEWRALCRRLSRLARRKKKKIEGRLAPTRNDEYLLYQTLIGSWPVELPDEEAFAEYRARIQRYMRKAVREAKQATSWINPNLKYENALAEFINALLGSADPQRNLFLREFLPLQEKVAFVGVLNSLAQTACKLTVPGVPDIYQGCEMLDFSLVDPDNRRPVDYDKRKWLLGELAARVKQEDPAAVAHALAEAALDGRAKLYLVWRLLQLRKRSSHLFSHGRYLPVSTAGRWAEHLCCFMRVNEKNALLVVVPRLMAPLSGSGKHLPLGEGVWEDTILRISRRELAVADRKSAFRDVFSKRVFRFQWDEENDGYLRVADVLAHFPVAVLERMT